MIAEIGLFALMLALFVAAAQAVVTLIGAARGEASWMKFGSWAAVTQCGLVALAFAALISPYVVSDLSGLNVVRHSHTDKPLIDKPAPAFDLPSLYIGRPRLKTADLNGHVALVNYFASWCVPCRAEHPVLRSLAGRGILLVGIDYKDKPENAQAFLAELGNPYRVVATDASGRTAIDFGVYGVPETYLIDKNGVIRYREAGPLTDDIVRKEILPLAEKLK